MHINPDKEPYWLHIKWPPVLGPHHENWQIQFIQLDPAQNEMAKLADLLERVKHDGKILEYTFQYIERFQSLKAFEHRMGRMKKGKRRKHAERTRS